MDFWREGELVNVGRVILGDALEVSDSLEGFEELRGFVFGWLDSKDSEAIQNIVMHKKSKRKYRHAT